MKRILLSLMIITFPFAGNATSWSGNSTTYGNTTYHHFHSNEITVLPPAQHHYHNDNGAATAAGVALGICAGALLFKGISSCINSFKSNHQKRFIYWNTETNRYEYCIFNKHTNQYEYYIY